MGHLGYTPQSTLATSGPIVSGKNVETALQMLQQAKALQQAGAFAIVLEMVPSEVAATLAENLSIATIGIGSGSHCTGQVLVTDDLLGRFTDFTPRFVRTIRPICPKQLAKPFNNSQTISTPKPTHHKLFRKSPKAISSQTLFGTSYKIALTQQGYALPKKEPTHAPA